MAISDIDFAILTEFFLENLPIDQNVISGERTNRIDEEKKKARIHLDAAISEKGKKEAERTFTVESS